MQVRLPHAQDQRPRQPLRQARGAARRRQEPVDTTTEKNYGDTWQGWTEHQGS